MIKFYPWILEWPYCYDEWPNIKVIGYRQHGYNRKINMRDSLIKTSMGDIAVIESHKLDM